MSWDEEAATWDDNSAVRAYSVAAYRSLGEVLAGQGRALTGLRVLDFGCGTGLLTEAMAKEAGQIVALDVSPKMLAVLDFKNIVNVQTLLGDLPALVDAGDAAPGSFDLVTCSSVCAFVEDYPATIAILARCLKPGGVLVQWDWELDPDSEEPFGLTRDAIQNALEAAGLESVRVDIGFEEPFEGMTMAPLRGVGVRPG